MKYRVANNEISWGFISVSDSEPTSFERVAELLLKLPDEQSCSRLLALAAREIGQWPDVALVRIWRTKPGDICDSCHFKTECPGKVDCVHLVASRGESRLDPDANWNGLDGQFSRFPMGVRKVGHVAATGEAVMTNLREDMTWIAKPDWAVAEGIKAMNAQPLLYQGKVLGVLGIFLRREIDVETARFQRMIADHIATSVANAEAFEEIQLLKGQLEQENEYLREELEESQSYGDIVGGSERIRQIVSKIDLVSPTAASVLIHGESGTGKELIAREIHRRSSRRDRPMIRVNCASIPANLFESELFGHAKGAFTGALKDRLGRFEAAAGGTLFLDEIGEMPLDLQAKLLRVLQEGQYERVGEDVTRNVDVRIVAATNRDLGDEVKAGRFREDLFYRLNVFPIEAPALRERLEDLPLLVNHFVGLIAKRHGFSLPRVGKTQLQRLADYAWPGNVRELQNQVERAMIVSRGKALMFEIPRGASLDAEVGPAKIGDGETVLNESRMLEVQRENIVRALRACGGKIYGADGAAALLEIKPSTLASRMKKFGVAIRVDSGLLGLKSEELSL